MGRENLGTWSGSCVNHKVFINNLFICKEIKRKFGRTSKIDVKSLFVLVLITILVQFLHSKDTVLRDPEWVY